jgi:predicted nuclease of restriction endonuclease-like RecB superfamily
MCEKLKMILEMVGVWRKYKRKEQEELNQAQEQEIREAQEEIADAQVKIDAKSPDDIAADLRGD